MAAGVIALANKAKSDVDRKKKKIEKNATKAWNTHENPRLNRSRLLGSGWWVGGCAFLTGWVCISYWHVQKSKYSIYVFHSVSISLSVSAAVSICLSQLLCRLPSLSAQLLCVSVILFSRQTKNTSTYQNVENAWQDCQVLHSPHSPHARNATSHPVQLSSCCRASWSELNLYLCIHETPLGRCPCKSQIVMTARRMASCHAPSRAFNIRLAAVAIYLYLYLHGFRCCFPLSGAPPKPIFKYFHLGFLANCLTAAVSCCQATQS